MATRSLSLAASTWPSAACHQPPHRQQSQTLLVWREPVPGSSSNNTCVVPLGWTWEQRAPLAGQQFVEATEGLAPFDQLTVGVGDSACDDHDLAIAVQHPRCRARVIPDYIFSAWPSVGLASFDATARELAALGAKSQASTNVCGWAGTTRTSPARIAAVAVMRQHPRLFALHEVKPLKVADPSRRFSWESQVREWSCLVDLVGGGYSGRVPLLLHTGRPLLYIERTVRTFYDTPPHAIQPWKHYVPVRADLHDLVAKAQWVVDNPAEARRIGLKGQEHAQRYLTRPAAIAAMRGRFLEALQRRRESPPSLEGPSLPPLAPIEPKQPVRPRQPLAVQPRPPSRTSGDPCAAARTLDSRRKCRARQTAVEISIHKRN